MLASLEANDFFFAVMSLQNATHSRDAKLSPFEFESFVLEPRN